MVTPAPDGLHLNSPGDYMKVRTWDEDERRASKPRSEQRRFKRGWWKGPVCSRMNQPFSIHLRCPHGAVVLPGMCNTSGTAGTNEGCSKLEVKDEILAKSCLQEFPCRALAKCPSLDVWTRAGLPHSVSCSRLILQRGQITPALSHHNHLQGNWLNIQCKHRITDSLLSSGRRRRRRKKSWAEISHALIEIRALRAEATLYKCISGSGRNEKILFSHFASPQHLLHN